ncbi:protein RER1-like isoform X2 [Rhopilema esculentum]|uniref:protein RER1-like isoform X2 n=1 Tax=Rhopilema esculentum TaxID=499914 RepID=UPI0031D57572|eukprot:gene6712-12274_t
MSADAPDEATAQLSTPSFFSRLIQSISQRYQKILDDSVPHMTARWLMLLAFGCGYMLRVYILQGWYIITYALGIYLLNLFIGFLSPRIDPALMEDPEDGPTLPQKANEEFKPFIRKLPEFKFWHSSFKAVIVALVCTCFDAFNVPVFWPILVMYFIILFVITMKRQIKHMIKYKYLPFTHGKRKYQGKESGQAFAQ